MCARVCLCLCVRLFWLCIFVIYSFRLSSVILFVCSTYLVYGNLFSKFFHFPFSLAYAVISLLWLRWYVERMQNNSKTRKGRERSPNFSMRAYDAQGVRTKKGTRAQYVCYHDVNGWITRDSIQLDAIVKPVLLTWPRRLHWVTNEWNREKFTEQKSNK